MKKKTNQGPKWPKCQILSAFAEYSVILGWLVILGMLGDSVEQLKVNIQLST